MVDFIDPIKEINDLLGETPARETLLGKANKLELNVLNVNRLIDGVQSKQTQTALWLGLFLAENVKFAYQNTRLLAILLEHPLLSKDRQKIIGEKLLARMTKLKGHATYPLHQDDYQAYEYLSLTVLAGLQVSEGAYDKAIDLLIRAKNFANESGNEVWVGQVEQKLIEVKQLIVNDETAVLNLRQSVQKLEYQLEIKTKELSMANEFQVIEAELTAKKKEAETYFSDFDQKKLELDRVNAAVAEGNETIQVTKTRLELLEKWITEHEEARRELEAVTELLAIRNDNLSVVSSEIDSQREVLVELDKAKVDLELINETIVQKVELLAGLEKSIKKVSGQLMSLQDAEEKVRASLIDLEEQELVISKVVAEMDEKIRLALDYSYRKTELDGQLRKITLQIEKFAAQEVALKKNLIDLMSAQGKSEGK